MAEATDAPKQPTKAEEGKQVNLNPYEVAEPIPVLPHPSRRKRSPALVAGAARPRSRTVQSARDAAPKRRQQRTQATRRSDAGRSQRHPSPLLSLLTRRKSGQERVRNRRKEGFGIIVGMIIAAIIVLLLLLVWIHRPVPVTINGEAMDVRIDSTLDEVYEGLDDTVTPGDYVTVSSRVLEKGAGQPFNAVVNGKKLSAEEVADYRIQGTESITFSDGDDIVEEYEATSEVVMPYLVFRGSGSTIEYVSQWGKSGVLEHRRGKESGEYADVDAVEAQQCVVTRTDLRLNEEEVGKYVALTFDDGPSDVYTNAYLEILDRYGIHATFFNLGDAIQQFPSLSKAVVERGHELGNHTMAHEFLTGDDAGAILDSITTSGNLIQEIDGVSPAHLRPPYGSFTDESWLASRGTVSAVVRWSADSQDWRLPGAQAIVDNALIDIHSGTVILMHEGGGDRSQDLEALPMLIERLQADGYQFVTIAELLDLVGDVPDDVAAGLSGMPDDAVWPEEIAPEGMFDDEL